MKRAFFEQENPDQERIKDFSKLKDVVQKKRKESLRELLVEKAEEFPTVQVASKLTGVESLLIIPVRPQEKQTTQFSITVFHRDKNGEEKMFSLSLGLNGTIAGRLPQEVRFRREELEEELAEIFDRIDTTFWQQAELGRLLSYKSERQVEADEVEPYIETKTGTESLSSIDLERLQFLQEHPKSLFGVIDKHDGLRGYRAVIFSRGIVLENPQTNNAAFVIPFEEAIHTNIQTKDLPKWRLLSKKEREKIIEQRVKPLMQKFTTKRHLIEQGARRVIHTPQTWKEKIDEVIIKSVG